MNRLALLVFFASGLAALVYQVVWQRLLVIFSGADMYSVTIIVAAYMSGLGIGSLSGGRLADRLGARRSLWMFAVAELCIGGFGLCSKAFYYDGLYTRFGYLATTPAVAAIVLFASLLLPTFLMGLSLPLLARALTHTIGASGSVIGSLYGWNTVGAAVGAFVTTWMLLPRLGLEAALLVGAVTSLACAAGAVVLGLRRASLDSQPPTPTPIAPTSSMPAASVLSFQTWLVIYAFTGFIALSLEIVWFRLLGVMLKSTSFTFGTLVGVYLLGLGIGAVVASRRVARSLRPGMTFLVLQYGITLYAAVSIVALMGVLGAGHPIKLVRYFAGYDPVDVYATFEQLRASATSPRPFVDFVVLYLVVPVGLIGLPTFVMGASFPYLQRAIHADFARLGRRLGALLAANIAGGVLGATLTGWLLLPVLGTASTLKTIVALGAVLTWPLAQAIFPGRTRAAVATGAVVTAVTTGLVLAMPNADTIWARLHSSPPRHLLFAEDAAGLSLLKAESRDFAGPVGVYVNGLGQSWIPYGNIHTALGALPILLHPLPREVAIIGLGSGDTVFAAGGRKEVTRIVCIEIMAGQRTTLQRLAQVHRDPGLGALLSDARIEHRVGDGRAYIQQAGRSFDVIEADALRPSSAFAGNLYSQQYFELLKRHLTPGGLAVTWAPTPRIQRTFISVFPHVMAFGDIYVGSNEAIPYDVEVLRERAATVSDYYAAAGVDINALLQPYLETQPIVVGPRDPRIFADLNTDVFPRDEFALPY